MHSSNKLARQHLRTLHRSNALSITAARHAQAQGWPARPSSSLAALRTEVTEITAPAKDVTADIMRAVMVLSLKNRLKQYQSVEADVVCDAMGLLDGRFNALSIQGRHWVTPLNMTAHKLEVDIGLMQVDYGTLLTQRKVAMKNIPSGAVRIHLSSRDMGNFLAHPMFQQAAATAVQGQPFQFHRDSVQIVHNNQGGQVQFSGTWAANGERYRVLMLPGLPGPGGVRPQLQVGAQHICEGGNHDLQGAQTVAQGIANFFSTLALDLQGIDIKQPVLTLHAGDISDSQEGDLLEIAMTVRLRAFPPLDMKF